jgi:threonine aldolase
MSDTDARPQTGAKAVSRVDTRLTAFASDNYAGVHPAILDAIVEANAGWAPAYGDDAWTVALEDRFRELLGPHAHAFPVFNGTGGNVTALGRLLRPWQAVICAQTAHINVDECGAPERFAGAKLIDLPTPDGKLTPDLVAEAVVGIGDQHHVQAAMVSVSQSTELGTVYTPDELGALAEAAHGRGLLLHIDGARLVNAAAGLGVELRALVTDCGVDALTFGGTKNGLLGGEAVVLLDDGLADGYAYARKQGMQLASKMRFVSAQLLRLLQDGLWREAAEHANGMARRLADGLRGLDIGIAYPVQANAVFAALPAAVTAELLETYRFYVWDEQTGVARLMCAWQTTAAEVDALVAATAAALTR